MSKPFEPVACLVDTVTGRLTNPTGRYEKRLSDLEGLYADAEAFEAMSKAVSKPMSEAGGDAVVYAVTEFRPSETPGDMIFGVTRMEPGRVGDEYFLTRGHIHAKADRPEIYFGQAGQGVMLLEAPDGETRTIAVAPGTVVYVPPYWIHRSVNTGPDELVMMFAYPADAGQDYGIIARSNGMRVRIVDDGAGGWREVPNADYRPRTPEEIAVLGPGS